MEPRNDGDTPGDPVRRPWPIGSRRERVEEWVSWFGAGRLVGAALAMAIVCAGAFWLVRTPPPPTEALLPQATTSTIAADATGASTAVGMPADAAPGPTLLQTMVVHVAGAVGAPGVYRLGSGARVDDAIRLAGGPTAEADADAVNLAAPLVDGSRIYIPVLGEEILPELAVQPVGPTPIPAPTIVDVNAATASELEELPGVGPATAAAIVTERDRNGPFQGVDDLDRVPGIGPAKLEALRDLVTT